MIRLLLMEGHAWFRQAIGISARLSIVPVRDPTRSPSHFGATLVSMIVKEAE